MAFVGADQVLVLEKAAGSVRLVNAGVLSAAPALQVTVDSLSERGMLGIAADDAIPPNVFIYFTEDIGAGQLANRVYRYAWNPVTEQLEGATLILDLPATPGPNHDGGVLVYDAPHLYGVIGDLNRNGQLQNFPAGASADDTSVIFRMDANGAAAPGNPFGAAGFERYFAYGVRNSFGLAVDPLTGALWDTENGPSSFDEINRVEPGMNSGWEQIMGPDSLDPQDPNDLFDAPGAGSTYSDPEFSWQTPVGVTAILFPVGSRLGAANDGVVLVGDNNNGRIYRFPLNPIRDALELSGSLSDLVADNAGELGPVIWGEAFGVVTDLLIGPDQNLYVVSLSDGTIYRVSGPPRPQPPEIPALPFVLPGLLALLLLALLLRASPTLNRSR